MKQLTTAQIAERQHTCTSNVCYAGAHFHDHNGSRVDYPAKTIFTAHPLERAILVNRETLADGSNPIRLSRSIRVF